MNEDINQQLKDFRDQIDDLDKKILDALAIRFSLADKIGVLKSGNNIPLTDFKREEEMIEVWEEFSPLEKDFLQKLLKLILAESKNRQKEK